MECMQCGNEVTREMFPGQNLICHVCVLQSLASLCEMEEGMTLRERSQGEQMGAMLRSAIIREKEICGHD